MASINIGLSGLNAIQTRLDVTSNNIANANTSNFKKQSVVLSDIEGGGIKATVVNPSKQTYSGNAIGTNGNNIGTNNDVALEQEVVNLKQQNLLYNFNANVIKAEDKKLGTLLDIKV